jgi:hypothetical protein
MAVKSSVQEMRANPGSTDKCRQATNEANPILYRRME